MFSVVLTFIAAMVLVAGIVVSQKRLPLDEYLPEPQEQVLSDETQTTNESRQNMESKVEINSSESDSSTNIEITNAPAEGDNDQVSDDHTIQQFIYPQSSVIAQGSQEIELTSVDDPEKITDWYKNKLQELDMNVNSSVSTSANGNVNNELVSAKGTSEVRIKIEKMSGSQSVNITVMIVGV